MLVLVSFLFACLFFTSQASSGPTVRRNITATQDHGAMCLDGSDYGYYIRHGSLADKWVFFFMVGGWCYSEQDCYGRSSTNVGSSLNWVDSHATDGIMSSDCTLNPAFCDFNLVVLPYCDGDSFSGARTEPVVVNGKPLYFRGHENLKTAITEIDLLYNLSTFSEVALSGCSAGGLSAYLHADYVASRLPPSVGKFGVVPVSGYFMDHLNVLSTAVYADQIRSIFHLANATSGLNQACIASKAPEDQWKCNMAPYTLPHIKSPVFALNSQYDYWQLTCIFTAEPVLDDIPGVNGNCSAVPGWACLAPNASDCSAAEIVGYNDYGKELVQSLRGSLKSTDGAFLNSCYSHCGSVGPDFYNVLINDLSASRAVEAWWASLGVRGDRGDGEAAVYVDCTLDPDQPAKCNPTCQS